MKRRSRPAGRVSYNPRGNEICFGYEDTSFWFRHRNGVILDILKRFPPPGRLYDVGGGNGFVSKALQDAGVDVTLVEPGPVGARNARKRGVRRIVRARLEDRRFRKGTLGAVGLFDVLEHIRDDGGFLRRVRETMAPEGRLYLTVPAGRFLWSDEDAVTGHFRRYGRRDLAERLHSAGFRIEYVSRFFGFLWIPMFLARVMPYRLGIRKPNYDRFISRENRRHAPLGGVVLGSFVLFMRMERWLMSKTSMPFGTSLLVAARKGNEVKNGRGS